MDLKRSLTFPTQDPNWLTKVGIGTLISLVPIFNLTAHGYSMDTLCTVYQGRETPLPEWNDLGNQFVRGLLGVVIQFLWSLPILIVACPLYAVAIGIAASTSSGDEMSSVGGLLVICAGLLVLVGSLVLAPLIMVAYTRFAVSNNFAEALPGPVLREIRGHFRPWFIIIGLAIAFGFVAAILGACTLGFGALLFIPLAFYMQLVAAHLFAQAHREAQGAVVGPPSMV